MRTAGRQFYDFCRISVFFALQFFVLQFALQCLRCKFFVQQLCLVVSLLVLQCFCAAVFWRCSFVAVQFLLRCSYFCVFCAMQILQCSFVLFALQCSVLQLCLRSFCFVLHLLRCNSFCTAFCLRCSLFFVWRCSFFSVAVF